jgi:hypothetical protein
MKLLELWTSYTREEVHSIFSPDTPFTPQAGTWGLQGMVRVPDRQGDWVFFVTFGQVQGEHIFDESITEDGVLSWQSQPSQGLSSDVIKSLIGHDDRVNNIHLFLRTRRGAAYGYFGTLGYLTHDAQRENPVHFQWQVLKWPPTEQFIRNVGITLVGKKALRPVRGMEEPKRGLVLVSQPELKSKRRGTTTADFRARKTPSYALIAARNAKLGLRGEELVLENEIKTLKNADLHDLAGKVVHVSVVEGDGAGYDIRSFDLQGNVKYIEVKSTTGSAYEDFYISPNEVEFSRHRADSYFLYRVFEVDSDFRSGKVFVLRGDLSRQLRLSPTQYRAEVVAAPPR